MLEALDTIDWSQVGSCYGRSEEIPAAIRGLVSDDATVRDTALGTLWMSLEHQSTVYEASALAVPFLLAILADPQTRDKRQLVHFLAHLGCRSLYLRHWYRDLQTRLILLRRDEGDTLFPQETSDQYRTWEEDTHQRFREGLTTLLPLLSEPDPLIREEVAFLLASFPEDRSMLLPSLIAHLQAETHEPVQCSLLLCLGHLLTPDLDASQLLLHYLEEGEGPLVQFTAARAVCTLLKEQTPEKVVQVLFEAFMYPHALQPSYKQLSALWGSGWIHARAFYYLDLLTSSPHQMLIMEQLVGLFPTLDDLVQFDCADLLIRVAFYEKNFCFQPRTTFDDLDPLQQAILQTLVAKETIWLGKYAGIHEQIFKDAFPGDQVVHYHYPPPIEALVCVGLPATRQDLQAFISTIGRE